MVYLDRTFRVRVETVTHMQLAYRDKRRIEPIQQFFNETRK